MKYKLCDVHSRFLTDIIFKKNLDSYLKKMIHSALEYIEINNKVIDVE